VFNVIEQLEDPGVAVGSVAVGSIDVLVGEGPDGFGVFVSGAAACVSGTWGVREGVELRVAEGGMDLVLVGTHVLVGVLVTVFVVVGEVVDDGVWVRVLVWVIVGVVVSVGGRVTTLIPVLVDGLWAPWIGRISAGGTGMITLVADGVKMGSET
jgi:hypothetical protein